MLTHATVCANIQQVLHPGTTRTIQTISSKKRFSVKSNLSVFYSFELPLLGNGLDQFQEVYICVLPFFHIYGMVAVMLTALEHGAKLVTLPRFESESYLNAVYNNHVRPLFVFARLLSF